MHVTGEELFGLTIQAVGITTPDINKGGSAKIPGVLVLLLSLFC